MFDIDLAYMPVTELITLIRNKQITPVEVVTNCLARIEEVNPKLNCFCFTYPEEALNKARAAEKTLMTGELLGPLHGVPIAFKDMTPTQGKTTTLGSYVYQHWVPDYSSVIVDKLEQAGAIMVGKTTTPEFAYDGFTHSILWGDTRNPWDLKRTSGGSSGGSSAAVAAGCVPWAEGCDMAGSVRLPAAFCNLVGVKPSLGRIPMDLLPSTFDNISHFGPLTHTIDDAALFMQFAQGPDERDIQSLVSPQKFSVPVPGDPNTLKLAFSMDLGHMAVDEDVQICLRKAVKKLVNAGAIIEEVDMTWPAALQEVAVDYWKVFMAAYFGHLLDTWRDHLDPNVVSLMEDGQQISAVTYKRMEIIRTQAWCKLAAILARFDALLCPVATMAAPPIGATYLDFLKPEVNGLCSGMDMTAVFNLVGQCPALSVPAGFNEQKLPIGLQIVGQRFDDYGTLCVGAAIEKVLGFSDWRPSI